MKKTRVPKGERYWSIRIFAGVIETFSLMELEQSDDEAFWESGNYFYSKEEAESMVRKLRAVLKGADAIEMPKEKDSVFEMKKQNLVLLAEFGWQSCYNWLKSKIVK